MGKNEINDILVGMNPPQDLRQRFTDPKTSQYDANQAKQYISQWKRSKNESDRQQLSSYITSLEFNRMMEKYSSLLTNSINIPKWFVEKQNSDNSQIAKISYVKVPYTTIADSAVKVTDAEIEDYINKHKDDFKQEQETRSIEYVSFNAGPNHTDSASLRDKLESMKQEFKEAKDVKTYLVKSGSETPFNDNYTGAKGVTSPSKDSIVKTPVGSVYGPYLDGNLYSLSKTVDEKVWPDTVKVRHILISTQQQNQQGQMTQIRDDSTAKKLADSIATAIRNGSNFDTLVVKFSDDPGSKDKGGVYDNVYVGQMVPTFNDFIFDHKVGEKGVVKTDFGYHYIEILSQKGNSPAYKIAYLTKTIFPSNTTDDSVNNAASQFAGNSRDQKSFDDNFEKSLRPRGLNKLLASDIKPGDASVNQVLVSRPLVKAIFNANKGDVLTPLRVGDNYIVATVTEINKAGTQPVSKARPKVEVVLLKKKKAQQLIQKIGKVSTLEAVSTAMNQPVQTADSIRMSGGKNLGYEPRVFGASLNTGNNGKIISEPIEGQEGVFAVKVESVNATSVADANIEDQKKQLEMRARQIQMANGQSQGLPYPTNVLENVASIKDNRSKFF